MDVVRCTEDMIEFPASGVLSKTIFEGASVEADLFMLPEGEKISEHTSSRDATVYIVRGAAEFTLGRDVYKVHAGDWFFMEAGLVHALTATSDLVFLLTLVSPK